MSADKIKAARDTRIARTLIQDHRDAVQLGERNGTAAKRWDRVLSRVLLDAIARMA